MRAIIDLGHPAHYHLMKNVARELQSRGCEVFFTIQKKDVLEELVVESGFPYRNILPSGRAKTHVALLRSFAKRFAGLLSYSREIHPDILVGTSVEIAYVGKILGIPSINVNEDDADAVPLYSRMSYPFSTEIVTPVSCNNGRWEKRSIKYQSYHELAYLHPNYFHASKDVVEGYKLKTPYFLIRFSALNAHHDAGVKGIDESLAVKVIDILSARGNVYVSCEKETSPELKPYRLNIAPRDIHHILYYSDMFVGDSQTMTAEAAVLGTPAVRFSGFVGRLGYLEELEQKYGLAFGVSTSDPDELLRRIKEMLYVRDLKIQWEYKRKKMLSEKIDFTAFIVWFIVNYPQSGGLMREDPAFQYSFR